jgi:hypothetical protein
MLNHGDKPLHLITCPVCHEGTLYSFFQLLGETVHCPCREAIAVANHYPRNTLDALSDKVGLFKNVLVTDSGRPATLRHRPIRKGAQFL